VELPSHDVLSQLARNDPAAYEAWRCEVIEDFINNAPEKIKPRLRGLQWRVECVRQQSKTALGSAVRLNDLMWKSFLSLNDHWQDLAKLAPGDKEHRQLAAVGEAKPEHSAQIIEFPGRAIRSPSSGKADDGAG
jgi:hypothetical protein